MKPRPLTRAELDRHPLPPVVAANKDAHGRLLIVGGTRRTPGSVVIAAIAAMRAGSGKVSIATIDSMAPHVAMAITEALVIGLPEGRDGGPARSSIRAIIELVADVDAVVAGPGLQVSKTCSALAGRLLDQGLDRLALDAGMLYSLPPHDQAARDAAAPILLPHNREMAALIGCDPEDITRDPLGCGRRCSERYGALTLVKGTQSHVVTPDGRAWKYRGGGPGLGVSGSGDALAGILGGLLARGAEPLAALLWAVWLHGEAGAALSRKIGQVGFLAREIPAEVPALLPG